MQPESSTLQNGTVLCLLSVYHCCVSEDLIYHLLLGELTSPGGLLWVLQKFLCMLSLGFCYPFLALLAWEPPKASVCPEEHAHNLCHLYPKLIERISQFFDQCFLHAQLWFPFSILFIVEAYLSTEALCHPVPVIFVVWLGIHDFWAYMNFKQPNHWPYLPIHRDKYMIDTG